jgi:hypothetical protein
MPDNQSNSPEATNAAGDSAYSNEASATTPSTGTLAVQSFTLINADTDQPIAGFDPLTSGATLNLATLPTRNLNIRANTSPATVGSVVFGFDTNPNTRTESGAPYALAGDASGNYFPWTPAVGPHTVKATPYSGSGATGTAGTPLTITFTVTDSGTATPPAAPTNLAASAASATQVNLTWTDNANNETGFKVERKTGANGTYAQIATPGVNATSYSDTTVAAGTQYTYRVRASNAAGDSAFSNEASATTPASGQSPFGGTPVNVTATIQAENFDNGGQGIAYNDLDSSNQGGQYRPAEGVDIEGTTDTGGGYNVGWIQAGEWLEYTVSVPTAGAYTLETRWASIASGGTFHVEFDGARVTGTLAVPNTGGWQTWQTVTTTTTPPLPAGVHVMRIAFDANATSGYVGNLNWVRFTQV